MHLHHAAACPHDLTWPAWRQAQVGWAGGAWPGQGQAQAQGASRDRCGAEESVEDVLRMCLRPP